MSGIRVSVGRYKLNVERRAITRGRKDEARESDPNRASATPVAPAPAIDQAGPTLT